jgi:hypothetical protein
MDASFNPQTYDIVVIVNAKLPDNDVFGFHFINFVPNNSLSISP